MDQSSRSNTGKLTVSHDDNIIKRHPDTENIIYPISHSRAIAADSERRYNCFYWA
jgi:hypothetical protein